MEITPSEQYLKELLDTLDGLESEEIAGALTQEGFIYALSGTVTGDIIRWAAEQMSLVIGAGDIAEVAAPVPGEVGRSKAIEDRDGLYEEPVAWLLDLARSIDHHRLPTQDQNT